MPQLIATPHPAAVTVLTSAGRDRLENRLAVAMAELERLDARSTTPIDALEVRDTRARLQVRIASLRAFLQSARNPDDVSDDPSIIELGDEVEVVYEDGERERFVLVHPIEIAAEPGYVSVEAPLGRALLGRRIGDRVAVGAPGGDYDLEIVTRRRSS
jgi:transcription elongation factor GreA